MADPKPRSIFDDAPIHRLGMYNAWRLDPMRPAPVDMVWISIAHQTDPAAHRVLPHGEPSIAIRRRRDRHGDLTILDLTVCGPFRQTLFYRPHAGEELIAVRLKPEIAGGYFGIDPEDYYDAAPALAPRALQDACASSLRLAEQADPQTIAQSLAMDLQLFAASRAGREAPEIFAAALLRTLEGRATCASLAQTLEVSERHLRRRFRQRLGCGPKEYGRQLRLTAASIAAEKEARPRWVDIADAAGFHDQAHMINEFKSMTGMTPQQLHQERRALL